MGVIRSFNLLCSLVIFDGDFERVKHAHHAGDFGVQVIPDAKLKLRHIDHGVCLGDANVLTKIHDSLRRVAPAFVARDGGQAGVVPPLDVAAIDQFEELAFAHDGVVHAKAGKFVLVGARRGEVERV